jgi:hypothetical protein
MGEVWASCDERIDVLPRARRRDPRSVSGIVRDRVSRALRRAKRSERKQSENKVPETSTVSLNEPAAFGVTENSLPLVIDGEVGSQLSGTGRAESRQATTMARRKLSKKTMNQHGANFNGRGRAASDDASGASAAGTAHSAAACSDRDGCAEAAQAAEDEQMGRTPKSAPSAGPGAKKSDDDSDKHPFMPLPDDVADFIDEIHIQADLFKVLRQLLKSDDEKIKQRALERLLEMKYGKGPAAQSDEVPQIIVDIPRPIRD